MMAQATSMPVWRAFRRTNERYRRADGRASNYWMAYCKACEAAYTRYQEALSACNGDESAISKVVVVPPPVPLPGRLDRMLPHLKQCKHVDSSVPAGDAGGRSDSQSDATPIVARPPTEPEPKRRRPDAHLESYFCRDLSPADKAELDKRLLLMIADRRLPFSFVESHAFRSVVGLLRQSAVARLPSRRQLGGPILDAAAAAAKAQSTSAVKSLLRGSARATLMLDGYKMANHTHILGAVIGIGPERCAVDATEEGYQHHGVAAASAMASVIDQLEALGDLPIGCVCTDDAGQCGRARRILALRYPRLVFLRCLAHQVNLLMRHVLHDSSLRPSTEAAVAAASLLARSSAKLLPQARASMHRLYGISLAIVSVCETRWSSLQACVASLLRVRGALRCLVAELGATAPSQLLPLNTDAFWRDLAAAEFIVRPIANASFILERDDTALADAFGIYGALFQHLDGASSHPGQGRLCEDTERRWSQEEQPLFLLAFCLHPHYMDAARVLLAHDWRGTPLSFSSAPCMANASAGYFSKWFPEQAGRGNAIVQQVFDFLTGDVVRLFCAPPRADNESYREAGWTWLRFWEFLAMGGTCPELAKFALLLLGCKPQTASVERLFKEYAAQQTKARNRMALSTVNKLTAVKAAYDGGRRRDGAAPVKSRNRVLDATERDKSTLARTGDAAPAASPEEAHDSDGEDAACSSSDVFQGGTAALADVDDADRAVLDDPRGEVPAFMAFDFSVPPVAELACPLPADDVPGYPQEVVWRLRNFRAARFPLRHIVGAKVRGQFVVDMCALMHGK